MAQLPLTFFPNRFNPVKGYFMQVKHKTIFTTLISSFSLSTFALSPITVENAKLSFDKPYLEFVKIWMPQDAVSKVFNFNLGGESHQLVKTFYTADGYSTNGTKYAEQVIPTFVEYCKANSGVHEKYGRQNFCISKAANKYPIAFMKWSFEDPNITFTHKDGYDASLEYAKVSSVKIGSTVTTKFGSGLVVETKDNGLFLFQSSRNDTLPRWITVDDLR
jgi:hypothetical protein